MTNEDVDEQIKRERVLKLLEEEIRRINVCKLYKLGRTCEKYKVERVFEGLSWHMHLTLAT